MIEIDNIKRLAKAHGWSLNYIYSSLGLPAGYLRDVNNGRTRLTDERLEKIAAFLGTSANDLRTPYTPPDALLEEKLLKLFRSLSPTEQKALLYDLMNKK